MANSDDEFTTAILGFSRSASLSPSARHWALRTAVLAPRLRSWTMERRTPDYSAAAGWAAAMGVGELRSRRTTPAMPKAQAARTRGHRAMKPNTRSGGRRVD